MGKVQYLSLCVLVVVLCGCAPSGKVPVPTRWVGGPVVLMPGAKGSVDDEGVKDPTIVQYQGKWHIFYTISRKDPDGICYVSGDSLETINASPRYRMEQFKGLTSDKKGGAPQVFYFEPQKLWYLIYQTKDFNRQPVYSTTATIGKPESWTKTRNLIEREEPDVKWIDFWVICDETKAYFFYSRGRKDVYVRWTKIEDFPNGFSPGQLAFSPMAEPLTEAVHIYKVKGKKQYHMLYETRPKSNPQRRYGLAVASNLLGPWERVADDYAISDKLFFADDAKRWTHHVSHGEMIRSGYDQRLEYDPADSRFLIQGVTEETKEEGWRLGIFKASFDKIE